MNRLLPILAVLALLSTTGCAPLLTDIETGVRKHGEWATWAGGAALVGGSTTVTHWAFDSPWTGYAAGMGFTVGREVGEAVERHRRDVPQARAWTTAMDIVIPMAAGALWAWWLDDDSDEGD